MELDTIDQSVLYFDGTKIEANAKKNSFVWKKAVIRYRDNLYKKITTYISKTNQLSDVFHYEEKSSYTSYEVGCIVEELMKYMVNENIEIVYGQGKRKNPVQKVYDKLLQAALKLSSYEEHPFILRLRYKENSFPKNLK